MREIENEYQDLDFKNSGLLGGNVSKLHEKNVKIAKKLEKFTCQMCKNSFELPMVFENHVIANHGSLKIYNDYVKISKFRKKNPKEIDLSEKVDNNDDTSDTMKYDRGIAFDHNYCHLFDIPKPLSLEETIKYLTSEKCEQKEIFEKQIEDLKNKYENEIGNLKKENLELKEKLLAKEAEIHPNDYQFDIDNEFDIKTEIKEEIIDQDSSKMFEKKAGNSKTFELVGGSMTIKEETNENFIPKTEINSEDFHQFQIESVVSLANGDGTMTIKEEINE